MPIPAPNNPLSNPGWGAVDKGTRQRGATKRDDKALSGSRSGAAPVVELSRFGEEWTRFRVRLEFQGFPPDTSNRVVGRLRAKCRSCRSTILCRTLVGGSRQRDSTKRGDKEGRQSVVRLRKRSRSVVELSRFGEERTRFRVRRGIRLQKRSRSVCGGLFLLGVRLFFFGGGALLCGGTRRDRVAHIGFFQFGLLNLDFLIGIGFGRLWPFGGRGSL